MSIRLGQPSDAHLFALAETIMGTAVAIDFIGKYSSLFCLQLPLFRMRWHLLIQEEGSHLKALAGQEVADRPVL